MAKNNKNSCPLLKNPISYKPDTIDLLNNPSERNYWLNCLENMVQQFITKAHCLNPDHPTPTKSAEICFEKFHALTEKISCDPQVLTPLSIRTLLEFNEDNLRNHSFEDAWKLQKQNESNSALNQFQDRIQFVDALRDYRERWTEIVTGVLAGNVFDWGSTVVANILQNDKSFGLTKAFDTIEKRPWFQDDLDVWINRLQDHPYKKVIIFVDNAGVDFVLGILPLTRELLREGTKVVLTANSAPALNDITNSEVKEYINEAACFCDILRRAIQSGQLINICNGQKGPCLDLTNLTVDLCDEMLNTDLIILEGMGRAVHTNYYAEFSVDCLKLAVLKNEWLAKSLGAQQFSVICDYKSPSI